MEKQQNFLRTANVPSTRYVACVSYEGAGYHGWQRLKTGLPTVQQEVEEALGKVANHEVLAVCAGRTDAGVHACGQVIHFDSHAVRDERSWIFGTNRYLPDSIALQWVKPVSGEFHARFSALSRRYIYIISNHIIRPSHHSQGLCWYYRPLDVTRMNRGARYLIGEHDFNAYRAVQCQASHAMRNVTHLEVKRFDSIVVVDIQANAFLHHMVRNIVGVLMKIGSGDREAEWANEVLLSRDRRCGGVTAPSNGLYFVRANYPDTFSLPENPVIPPFLVPFL